MNDVGMLYSKRVRLVSLLNQANQNGYHKMAERYQREIDTTNSLIDEYNKRNYGYSQTK